MQSRWWVEKQRVKNVRDTVTVCESFASEEMRLQGRGKAEARQMQGTEYINKEADSVPR